jgi:hypothetical protein
LSGFPSLGIEEEPKKQNKTKPQQFLLTLSRTPLRQRLELKTVPCQEINEVLRKSNYNSWMDLYVAAIK